MDAGEQALALVLSLIDKLVYRWCSEHLEVFDDKCPVCLSELERERTRDEEYEALKAECEAMLITQGINGYSLNQSPKIRRLRKRFC